MNPLSPLTYYRRHKRNALLLVALISLATFGLYIIVAVLDTIPTRANVNDLMRMSRVTNRGAMLESGVVAQIQNHPGVARAIFEQRLAIFPPTLLGQDMLRLIGVSPAEAEYLMTTCEVRLKEGRMFAPRTNEFVLSEETARALGLHLGDQIDRERDKTAYNNVLAPLVLVGILEGDPATMPRNSASVRLGFVSGEYLSNHELYTGQSSGWLVVAQAGHQAEVEAFLETQIASERVTVETSAQLIRLVKQARMGLYLIFGIVNCVIAIVVAGVVGVINQIALTKRLAEFGLLHALGQHKNALIRRLTAETAVVAGIGWSMGLGIAWLILTWLKTGPYYALGMELDMTNRAPLWFVLPIPLVVIGLAFLSVMRIFGRLDAVAIVERGKLTMEAGSRRRKTQQSTVKPLSALTFYLRHQRRGLLLVLSTALMILGIAFPVFILSALSDSLKPRIGYLQYVSEVSSTGRDLDPGIVAQIKTQPAVQTAVTAIPLSMQLTAPLGSAAPINLYGVTETDLPQLLQLFGLHIQEGRLPQPRTNEIVISAALARNRGLRVGDAIGGKSNAAPGDEMFLIDDIQTPLVIVGLLSPDTPWIGFASYEYLTSHELTAARAPHLLIIPAADRKAELDGWLEQTIASEQTDVKTYDAEMRMEQENLRMALLVLATLECVISLVAAISLATLNYIFFTQRREEFGILHAIGHSRLWLTLRTLQETGSVAGLAWLLGAILCGISLVIAQANLYAPRGLSLNFANLTPWLFTLPIPLTIIIASTGTIAWMLSRLDPLAIVERR